MAYDALAFLFESHENGISHLRVVLFFGSFLHIVTLHFINSLSHEVSNNLSKLKQHISKSPDISFEEKWELIENMNSFNGFDACGYFTLGKPHLTSIVSNFTTFIIVLTQFRMAEKP